MNTNDLQILLDIMKEREGQRTKFTIQHDKEHDGADWIALITIYLGKAASGDFGNGPSVYEYGLIQVAALAMAAIEHERARS